VRRAVDLGEAATAVAVPLHNCTFVVLDGFPVDAACGGGIGCDCVGFPSISFDLDLGTISFVVVDGP
jgi:hypothetical protein